MTFVGLLPHIAKVYRAPLVGGEARDRLGQPITAFETDAPLAASFRCRLTTARSGGVLDDERTTFVFAVRHVLFAAADVDCAEDDVVEVLAEDGTVLLPKSRVRLRKDVYGASVVHHVEIDLEARRGPDG